MLVLDSNKTLQLVGGLASHTTHCSASAINIAASADTPISSTVVWTNTTTQTLVASPAVGEQKVIKNITVRVDSGTGVSVAFVMNSSGTPITLFSAKLSTGESVVYEDGKGFSRHTASGAILTVTADSSKALAATVQTLALNKSSLNTMVAGSDGTMWRSTGYPLQGAVPAAAAVCSNLTTGAIPLAARSGLQVRRLASLALMSGNAGQAFFLEDRLAHMGGLSGTVTTAQTVNLDLSVLADNISERIGDSTFDPYREVNWYLEWYTATGATVATPTVNVTYADGTTGNCNIWVLGGTALPASVAASRRYAIISATGKAIRGVNTVTLSASTATAGSFGVTATRILASVVTNIANKIEVTRFPRESAPVIYDNSCLTLSFTSANTSSGTAVGTITQEAA